jgi:protein-S-isoprenylcysteine O-methyltransferase Ste14
MYTASLLVLWFTPLMSEGLLAFNLGTTLYFVIGGLFEERKLLRQFGPAYAEYRRRTPMLIPGLPRRD